MKQCLSFEDFFGTPSSNIRKSITSNSHSIGFFCSANFWRISFPVSGNNSSFSVVFDFANMLFDCGLGSGLRKTAFNAFSSFFRFSRSSCSAGDSLQPFSSSLSILKTIVTEQKIKPWMSLLFDLLCHDVLKFGLKFKWLLFHQLVKKPS